MIDVLVALSLLLPAKPPCAMAGTCEYMPGPVDGPMMPTWRTENTYGGWTNTPVECDPVSYQCRMWAPQ